MEVTDTGDPGREEFFRNLFQSTGVTASQAGPCENGFRAPPFGCHRPHHLITEIELKV